MTQDDLPDIIVDRRALYRAFRGHLHQILDTSGDETIPLNERALSFDFKDTLRPNKKYYYTARSIDVHGKKSNPSIVYEVELVYHDGVLFPEVKLYHPPVMPATETDKKFARFIEIKASEIQTEVYEPTFATSDADNDLIGKKGLAAEKVVANKFVVRFTSIDTGRKFDINLSFTNKDV